MASDLPLLPDCCATDALCDSLQQSEQPGLCARRQIQLGQQQLDADFDHLDIEALVEGRSRLIDNVLCALWRHCQLEQFSDLALLAVGGYGRGQLHPYSDVDLLLLSRDPIADDSPERSHVEQFIALLWDAGLEIGHAVRSLEQCAALAKQEIKVATNIMEARTLCGANQLLPRLLSLTSPQHIWPVADFFSAKREEQYRRHHHFNDTEYNLEPDLKRAPGGLRDLQTITWVTRRYFHAETLEELVETGFLTQREFSYLMYARNTLWRIRWALHQQAGRNENRLLFDYQRDVAKRLGYDDDGTNMAVEHLMRNYYRSALAISVLNELLLQLFEEAILEIDEEQRITPLNRHFQVHNDYLEAVDNNLFQTHPAALLEAFLLQADNPAIKGIRAATIRSMFEARHVMDDAFRESPANGQLFMQLLATDNPYPLLLQMKRYGILAQYLPEFGRIIGMMQYDLFHLYTVDTHILLVIRNLRRLQDTEPGAPLSLTARIIYRLPKPSLLYVAALYHDIAKGRDGDHSELGAADVRAFGRRHGLEQRDIELVVWLVEQHLLMSSTAQRKDISDPQVVHDFARQVGDLVRLDYLFILTIADISATNPSLWNSWRESLLTQLHTETTRALRRGLDKPIGKQEWIRETRNEAVQLLQEQGISSQDTTALLARLGDDYFLQENASDIAWHTEAILEQMKRPEPDCNQPLVLLRDASLGGTRSGTQIFIYTPDSDNLFAVTVNALDHLDLTIVDANIITSSTGFSLDTYIVLDEKGQPIDDPTRLNHIREQLQETLKDPSRYRHTVQRHQPRRYRHFDVPTKVVLSNNLRNDFTVIDIEALDHPGLLAHIGYIFSEFNLLVQNARIATQGERVEDSFFVTDKDGSPLNDPAFCKALQQRLEHGLDALSDNEPDSYTI